LDGGEERRRPFGIAGGNSAPALKVEHGVFHQVTEFIEVLVVFSLNDAVLFGRNNRIHSLPGCLLQDGIGVVAAIGQKMVRLQAFDEVACLCTIRSGTWRNKNSDWQTMRIHGQMYLGVEPPFVLSMASLPPGEPAAWGWILI